MKNVQLLGKALAVLALLCSTWNIMAATVTGTVVNSSGSPVVVKVAFIPAPAQFRASSPSLIQPVAISTNTTSSGTFSIQIVAGTYYVWIAEKQVTGSNNQPTAIVVPAGSSSYNWTAIIGSGAVSGVSDTAYLLKTGGIMSSNISFSGGSLIFPSYTTSQRTGLTATNGLVVYDSTIGSLYSYVSGAWVSQAAGAGTVTSVAVTSSDLTIGGSPITSSGTITIALPSNLTGWNAISTNHLTSTNNFLTFSNSLLSIYQTGSANLTNWSGTTTNLWTTLATFQANTNYNAAYFQPLSANLTAWSGTASNLWTTLSQFSNFTNGLPAGLPASGATAGSYTLASITVDAYGRVTAASSGTSVTLNGLTTIPSTGGVSVNVAAAPATNVVDVSVASATNILDGALTILHATNGATASERTHVRWLWTDGTTRALTIPSGWKTNVNSAVPASITNGAITKMYVTSIGDTSTSANQTNVFVSFEFYK